MLTKLKPAMAQIWTAMLKQRAAVLIVVVIGAVVALFAPIAPPVRDVAAHDVTIANVAIPGFDPPCTAASLPAFAKNGDVLKQVLVNTGARLDAGAISTQLRAPNVMAIRYAAPAAANAGTSTATSVASAVVAVCNASTNAAVTALGNGLGAVQAQRQGELQVVDAKLLPANRQTSKAAVLSKRLDALNAQRIDAQQKLDAQRKLAEAAEKQQKALLPLAAREIQANDSLAVALRAQRDKDAAALAAARAQYQDKAYPGLEALERRVKKDEAASIERNKALVKWEPQTLSPAYRAAQAAADQARAAADAQTAQIATIDAQIKPLDAQIAALDAYAVDVAANTRARDALLKAYQVAAAQHYAVAQQEAVLPALTLAAAPEPDVETVGVRLAALVRAAVALAFVVFAAILAVVLNALDRRLLTVDAITKLYGKPVISIVGPKSHA